MLKNLKSTLEAYVETKIELAKLDVEVILKKMLVKVSVFLIGALSLTIAISLLLIAFAFFLNTITDSPYVGFLILGVFFLCISFFLYLKRYKLYQYLYRKLNSDNA